MKLFPVPVVVDARPGGDRPVVVELPVERAHADRLQMTPELHACFDRERLLNLAEVDEILESGREAEVAGKHLHDS